MFVLFADISKKRNKKQEAFGEPTLLFLFFVVWANSLLSHFIGAIKKCQPEKTAKKRVKKQNFSCFFVVLEKQLGNVVVGIVFGKGKKKWFGLKKLKRCRFGIEEKLGCVAFGYVFGIDVTFLTNSGCCGENEYFGQKTNFKRQANTNTKRPKQSCYFFLTNKRTTNERLFIENFTKNEHLCSWANDTVRASVYWYTKMFQTSLLNLNFNIAYEYFKNFSAIF